MHCSITGSSSSVYGRLNFRALVLADGYLFCYILCDSPLPGPRCDGIGTVSLLGSILIPRQIGMVHSETSRFRSLCLFEGKFSFPDLNMT